MAEKVFDFCTESRVIKEIAPDEASPVNLNGWEYAVKPSNPYQRSFSAKLYGLRWYLGSTTLDLSTDKIHNAGRLLKFYEEHRLYKPFTLHHEYLGPIKCRFKSAVNLEPGVDNSNGLIEEVEIMMLHVDPRF